MKNNKATIIGVVLGVIAIIGIVIVSSSFQVVEPGMRGVLVTLGTVDQTFRPEGLAFKTPLISTIHQMPIRQQSFDLDAESFSKDLQLMKVKARLLFRYNENMVVQLYKEYGGGIDASILEPKLQESIKEVTATRTAEAFVKSREEVKLMVVKVLKEKIGTLAVIDDVVLSNIDLSDQLEKAIEDKMVQEQKAGQAKFAQDQARIDAETAKIRAQGEADSIRIRSEALEKNPKIINLMIAEKWNGVSPLVVGQGAEGSNVILPLGKEK